MMNQAFTQPESAAICSHMNEDHADAVAAYARTYAKIAFVKSAQILALDVRGMELAIDTDNGRVTRRVDFDHELTDKDDARDTLIRMARAATTAD